MKDNIKDSIKIPKDLDKAVLDGFNRGKKEKQRMKKANIIKKGVMVAGIAMGVTLIAGIMNPDIVNAIPGAERIIELFKEDRAGKPIDNYKNYTTAVKMSKSDNGITVTLDDVVIDDNKFLSTLIVEGDKVVGDKIEVEVRPQVNGEPLSGSNSSVKRLGDNKVAVMTSGNTSDIKLGENIDLKVSIGGVLTRNPDFKEINGDWEMDVKVKKQEDLKHSIVNNNEKTMSGEDMKIKTGELIVSKLGATLKLSGNQGTGKVKETFQKIGYVIRDDKGQEFITDIIDSKVNPDTGDFELSIEILSKFTDSKYLEVIPVIYEESSQFKDGENGYTLCQLTPSVNNEKEEEILPIGKFNYIIDKARKFVSLKELVGNTIEVNNNTKVTINNIEDIEDGTKITLETKGLLDNYDINNLMVIDSDFNIHKKSEDSSILFTDSSNKISIIMPKLDGNKKYKAGLLKRPDSKIYEDDKVRLELK